MLVLIPAYEPDEKLLGLLEQIHASNPDQHVLIVDDGSGPDYQPVFDAAASRGAVVIGHPVNRGKGYALKNGFACAAESYPDEVVVCADCDGQHTYEDINRVGREVARTNRTMVLGARDLSTDVPVRSRLGNAATKRLFGLATGTHLRDTQTGLRGYPSSLLPWLCTVSGERFDYELRLLLEAKDAGVGIVEVPTATIYIEGNASSHFRPIVDSARVYAPLLRFIASSISAFVLDLVVLLVMMALTSHLLVSVVTARVVSSATNYATNRTLVFSQGRATSFRSSAPRYFALVTAILAANYALMRLVVSDFGLPLILGKVITESVLFAVSYQAQQRWIFRHPKERPDARFRSNRRESDVRFERRPI
jgi:glycosyltransferase involved in cell wall biosynthesis